MAGIRGINATISQPVSNTATASHITTEDNIEPRFVQKLEYFRRRKDDPPVSRNFFAFYKEFADDTNPSIQSSILCCLGGTIKHTDSVR